MRLPQHILDAVDEQLLKKLERGDAAAEQRALRSYAQRWSEDISFSKKRGVQMRYDPAFPVKTFTTLPLLDDGKPRTKEGWRKNQIFVALANDEDPSYWPDMCRDFKANPEQFPPIVVRVYRGGVFTIPDGNHRTACAVTTGMKTVRAVVGEDL